MRRSASGGDDYTGLLPLHDSQGNRVAALCVDVDVTEIHRTLRNRIIESISLIVLLGIGFIVVFIVWAGRNVIRPIEQLERSAVEFASKCRDQKDAEALKIETPDIRVDNEIATLAGAVSEMSEAMRDYVKGMATAEKAARDAETIAELRESISALFDNMPGITFSKDANTGVYLACNQAFAEYAHRQSPEEVVGLTDADFFDPATAEHIAETDRQAIAMDEPCTFYEHVLDATGRQRHLQTTKLKYVDPAGRQCVLGMCADVTDTHAQMQANSMITAMAADYRCVYYVNLDENDGVCYRDDPSDSEQTPAGVHFPYLERFTWYAENSVAEMYREGFLEFINPDNLRRRLSTQPLIAYRYLAKRENREYYEMIRAAGVRRAEERDDHTVHAIGLGLTKIDKEMRETMAKNEALAEALTLAEEASKAKTTFLSNMSHEIRTPMNAIIGLDTLALRDETLTPQTREYLEKIGGSARHLLALINDILDMSRIESGRMVLKSEEFSFRDFIDQINVMINGQCVDKGLDFDCHIVGQVEDYYIGDDMKLKQVLINILGNAVKFTPVPGSVTFTVEQVAEFEGHCTLRFTMKDTGIGMSKEYIPKIFEAFSQENSGATNKYGSTGLGMAITKNIVDMMNGEIAVDSEKGMGTTFTVTVTLKASSRSVNSEQGYALPAGLRILVVDDDEVACEHARLVANAIGVHADTVTSAREALDRLQMLRNQGKPYDFVLTDYKMPDMNGIELAQAIRTIDGGETAIIVLTGYSWDDMQGEAKSAGVDGIMSKPLFTDSLMRELTAVLDRRGAGAANEGGPVIEEAGADTEYGLGGCRVLIAEDMEINAEILMDLLEMEDIESEHAENGQLAVEMFNAKPLNWFDAVLMDVRMPVMDGLEATRAIRELDRPDARTVPIIAMTANAFDEDVQRSLQAGMTAHLSKPVEPERLYETLDKLIHAARQNT